MLIPSSSAVPSLQMIVCANSSAEYHLLPFKMYVLIKFWPKVYHYWCFILLCKGEFYSLYLCCLGSFSPFITFLSSSSLLVYVHCPPLLKNERRPWAKTQLLQKKKKKRTFLNQEQCGVAATQLTEICNSLGQSLVSLVEPTPSNIVV